MSILVQLIGGAVLLWGILLYPGWLWQGPDAFPQSAAALGLCLIPAVGTFLWASRAFRGSPESQMAAMLGGSGIRMFLVLGLGFGFTQWWPETFPTEFWGWILVFYLFILGLEIRLLIRAHAPQDVVASPQDGTSI